MNEFDDFKPIPISGRTDKPDVFDNDEEHRGHSYYIGYGSGVNNDYWDCYCLPKRGSRPPGRFDDLLQWVDNPDDVIQWKKEYNFDTIICFCWCCQGAFPVLIYGWSSEIESEDEENEADMWTAALLNQTNKIL
jgi:hypothetical protein